MKTFIINLERSKERKEYMQGILEPFTSLHKPTFMQAVDGKELSDEAINQQFLQAEAYKRYGRFLKKSEVGCTLSHRKCYKALTESDDNVAFIMEDDILFRVAPSDMDSILHQLKQHIETDCPTIIILFGEYWWTKSKSAGDDYQLKHVYDAISAQGYLINQPAAQLLLREKASSLADDWEYIISKGIKVQALYPHIIDQEWKSFETTVSTDGYASFVRKNLKWNRFFHSYWRGGIKHFLKAIGHFDPHQIPEGTPEWAKRLGL